MECRESMASRGEFRRANEIIRIVKRADGQNAHIFDVLDITNTSQWWWKDHKKWFFHRHPFMSIIKFEGEPHLVYTEPEKLPEDKLQEKLA